jgi:hypothetical protein
MSHEIAHALARHGGERISQNMAVAGLRSALDFVTKDREKRQRELIMKAYGIGTEYGVILPYSRKHETEADHMGLMLMARAGYDPAEAPRFWQRFAALNEDGTLEFLSTHPSDERRAEDLLALLPEAQLTYRDAAVRYGMGEIVEGVAPQALASRPGPQPAGSPEPSPDSPATFSPAFAPPAFATPHRFAPYLPAEPGATSNARLPAETSRRRPVR